MDPANVWTIWSAGGQEYCTVTHTEALTGPLLDRLVENSPRLGGLAPSLVRPGPEQGMGGEECCYWTSVIGTGLAVWSLNLNIINICFIFIKFIFRFLLLLLPSLSGYLCDRHGPVAVLALPLFLLVTLVFLG